MLGGSNIEEMVVYGNIIVIGSDGIERTVQFNTDGTVTWKRVDSSVNINTIPKSDIHNGHSIYDLQGIAIPIITKPGFYIIDGVKMYVNPTRDN